MKIGIDCSCLVKDMAGVGRYVKNLIKIIPIFDNVNEYYYIFPTKVKKYSYLESEYKNIKILFDKSLIFKTTRKLILWQQLRLPAIVKTLNINKLFCPENICPLFLKTEIIIFVQDVVFHLFPETMGYGQAFKYKTMVPLSIKKAGSIIVSTNAVKKDLIKYNNSSKNRTKVIHFGIDDIFFNQPFIKMKNCGNYFLFVGTNEPRKNLYNVIKGFKKYLETFDPTQKLVICGSKGWKTGDIKNLIIDLKIEGSVVFPGYLSDRDLIIYYDNSDALIFISLYEGFGFPLLESFSRKKNVIASDIPALKEIGGDYATYVDHLNPSSIANGLRKVKEYSSNNPNLTKYVRENFKLDAMAKKTISIFTS